MTAVKARVSIDMAAAQHINQHVLSRALTVVAVVTNETEYPSNDRVQKQPCQEHAYVFRRAALRILKHLRWQCVINKIIQFHIYYVIQYFKCVFFEYQIQQDLVIIITSLYKKCSTYYSYLAQNRYYQRKHIVYPSYVKMSTRKSFRDVFEPSSSPKVGPLGALFTHFLQNTP